LCRAARGAAQFIIATHSPILLAIPARQGCRYATFVLDDGLSFVHIAISDGGEISPVLRQLPAFVRFRDTLQERCDEAPVATRMTTPIGAYGF